MPLGSILLILALLILVALFVARPLVNDEHLGAGLDPQRSHWIAERERTLDALLELDFDHQLGKVPEDVYTEQRGMLMRQGAEALKQLEALDEQVDSAPVAEAPARRSKGGHSDDQLEAMIAKRRKQRG